MDLTTKIERLAIDLRTIAENGGPSAFDLESAPLLVNWRHVRFSRLGLEGDVIRHPKLGSATGITTSQLYWLAPDRRAARTLSRLYRLSDPFPF